MLPFLDMRCRIKMLLMSNYLLYVLHHRTQGPLMPCECNLVNNFKAHRGVWIPIPCNVTRTSPAGHGGRQRRPPPTPEVTRSPLGTSRNHQTQLRIFDSCADLHSQLLSCHTAPHPRRGIHRWSTTFKILPDLRSSPDNSQKISGVPSSMARGSQKI